MDEAEPELEKILKRLAPKFLNQFKLTLEQGNTILREHELPTISLRKLQDEYLTTGMGSILGYFPEKKIVQVIGKDTCLSVRGIPLITVKDITYATTTAVMSSLFDNKPQKTATLVTEEFILNKMEAVERSLWRSGVKNYSTIATIDEWVRNHPKTTVVPLLFLDYIAITVNNEVLKQTKKLGKEVYTAANSG